MISCSSSSSASHNSSNGGMWIWQRLRSHRVWRQRLAARHSLSGAHSQLQVSIKRTACRDVEVLAAMSQRIPRVARCTIPQIDSRRSGEQPAASLVAAGSATPPQKSSPRNSSCSSPVSSVPPYPRKRQERMA